MNRGNQILAAVLALQLVLVAVVFWPKSVSVAEGELLFPELEADPSGDDLRQIVRLTISDDEGRRIQLVKEVAVVRRRQRDRTSTLRGDWVLSEAGDYPCKTDAVPNLLEKLVAIKTDRLVTQTRSSHRRLQVSDQEFQRLIEFDLADGATYRLYLGTAPSYGVSHVRRDGHDEVYLASDLAIADVGVRAANWIDVLYFSVAQDQVVAITLENVNGRFEFQKGEAEVRRTLQDDAWAMDGLAADETLSQNNVTSLVNRVSSVQMLSPLGKEEQDVYGFESPRATITVQVKDEEGMTKTLVLLVGAQSDADSTYVVKSSESPYYVTVAEYTVKDWVEKTRDDFLP